MCTKALGSNASKHCRCCRATNQRLSHYVQFFVVKVFSKCRKFDYSCEKFFSVDAIDYLGTLCMQLFQILDWQINLSFVKFLQIFFAVTFSNGSA